MRPYVYAAAFALMLGCTATSAHAKKNVRVYKPNPYTIAITSYVTPLVESEREMAVSLVLSGNHGRACRSALKIYSDHLMAHAALQVLIDSKGVPRWARKALRTKSQEGLRALVMMSTLLDTVNCRHDA